MLMPGSTVTPSFEVEIEHPDRFREVDDQRRADGLPGER